MDRYFARVKDGKALIEGEEFRHLKVKRTRVGDRIEVITEEGDLYLCTLKEVKKREATAEVLKRLPPRKPEVFVELAVCVPVKVSLFDEIVQKATEVGVSKIVPLISKRSFQKAEVLKQKLPRWEKIAREALKQSGRSLPPLLEEPKRLGEFIPEGELKLLAYERGGEWITAALEGKTSASLLVGPEGGFDLEEVEFLKERGWKPVSIGDFVMRTQTAAPVFAALAYAGLKANLKRGTKAR